MIAPARQQEPWYCEDRIEIEEISAIDDLEALRFEWSCLWNRCPSATAFQSPEWLIPWWRHLGNGDLMVLALRQEGRLIGLAPFFIFISSLETGGTRTLLFVGTGNSDYLDLLLDPDCGQGECLHAIFNHLSEQSDRWDLCDLHQLPPDSPLLTQIRRAPPNVAQQVSGPADLEIGITAGLETCATGLRYSRLKLCLHEPCPSLTLPPTLKKLPDAIPGRQLEKSHYYGRKLAKLGPTRLEAANKDNFRECLDALLRLHRARWSAKGGAGLLTEAAIQHFHGEAAWALLDRGALRLFTLRLMDQIVGVLYGFVLRPRRACYYLSGFDPEFEKFSLGTLLIGHCIEEATREGAVGFDFLRGQEAYKYHWGAKDRPTYRCWFRPEDLSPGK